MVDLSTTIAARSDQLNADDLMGGPRTIRVTRVAGMNDKEQPIAIFFDGDRGKPYKPGKSMRRVLVNFWGKQGDEYAGRCMTLFRDPNVEFGGIKVGGIRISHMSHLGDEGSMALAVTRGAKRLYRVKPLQVQESGASSAAGGNGGKTQRSQEEQVDAYVAALDRLETLDDLRAYQLDERRARWLEQVRTKRPDLAERIVEANSRRAAALASQDDDDDTTDLREPVSADDDDRFLGDNA